MKKINFLMAFFLFSALLLGRAYGEFRPLKAKGVVNRSEIGGNPLGVVSIWDKQQWAPVSEDGSFITVISNQRPQKLYLRDKENKTRALTISLPKYRDNIVFDAKSTAIAVLFQDASSFGQPEEVENFCRLLENEKSFKDLVLYFKKNLSNKPLEDLSADKEYVALFEKCNSEIFGEDQQAIRESMHVAQKELEKVLK